MEDDFVLIPPQASEALGAFATRFRSSVLLAADSVRESSLTLVEHAKEKGSILSDSLAENVEIVKTKSIEVAENVKEKSAEVADTVKKGAVAVAENVQGRVAPKTVKREGYLSKQANGKWIEYYFILRDGSVFVLPTKDAELAEFSVSLDCIERAEPMDILVTGKPHCFRVSVVLRDKPETVVNNWSFFGLSFFSSNRINNQELDIILQAADEDEMKGWVRELYSTASGLAIQDHLRKTGTGAMKFAAASGVYSFVGTLTGLVGYRAGRNVADKIIR